MAQTTKRKTKNRIFAAALAVFMFASCVSGMTASAFSASDGATGVVAITGTSVNTRKGAGTNYGKVTMVTKPGAYECFGSKKDSSGKVWYNIKVGGKSCYVISTYASYTKYSEKQFLLTGDVVNVRSGPGTSYTKLGSFRNNTEFEYLGEAKASNGAIWYKTYIPSLNRIGYFHSDYAALATGSLDGIEDGWIDGWY